ncbi:MAG: class F420-dependent oxidoreductase [Actinomycetia bacterium]|nr:class F420-dependent oxidoreductase [Actinomycetes bacterium]
MLHGGLLAARPELAPAYCRALEANGVESVWVVEHVAVAEDYAPAFPYGSDGQMRSPSAADRPDPLDLLAWLAPQTSLRLGTGVVIAPLHSPVILAKRAATVDALSGGRLLLGVGIGWQREEYAAIGVPFADRGERLEEGIAVMRALWGEGPATHHGRYVDFDELWCRPRPAQGTIPIIAGGNSAGAVDRAGRIADGWFPFAIEADEVAELAGRLAAAAGGREVPITAWPGTASADREGEPEYVQRFVDAGASRLLFQPALDPDDPVGSLGDGVAAHRRAVLDHLDVGVLR